MLVERECIVSSFFLKSLINGGTQASISRYTFHGKRLKRRRSAAVRTGSTDTCWPVLSKRRSWSRHGTGSSLMDNWPSAFR